MTDEISFPPLLDLPPDELHREKERLLSEITQRVAPPSPLSRVLGRRPWLAAGIAVTAATAIALPLVFVNGGASRHSSPRVSPPPRRTVGGKGVANAVSVSDLNAANALLPFKAVFPSGVTPTGIQVSTLVDRPSDPAWGLSAHFDTANVGSYMLSEWTSDGNPTSIQRGFQRPVTTLQRWVADTCQHCASQVVTEDGVPVEVLASSLFGLHLYWIRGGGTSSPVAAELDWSTDMPPNNVIPSQQAALAIAGDIISQGG